MQTITVYIDSDASTLGPSATQGDLDAYAQNARAMRSSMNTSVTCKPETDGPSCSTDRNLSQRTWGLQTQKKPPGEGWPDVS
jgi:hypothetical protein